MLRDWPAFHDLAKAFAEGPVCLRVVGLTGGARPLAVAELLQTPPRTALVLVPSVVDAHRFTQDLRFFGAPALEFPEREPRLWRGGRPREARPDLPALDRRAPGAPRPAARDRRRRAGAPPRLPAGRRARRRGRAARARRAHRDRSGRGHAARAPGGAPARGAGARRRGVERRG